MTDEEVAQNEAKVPPFTLLGECEGRKIAVPFKWTKEQFEDMWQAISREFGLPHEFLFHGYGDRDSLVETREKCAREVSDFHMSFLYGGRFRYCVARARKMVIW